MLTNLKITLAVLCLTAFVNTSEAQQGTLEFTSLSSNIVTTGPSTAPIVATFREDIQNLTANTIFRVNSPALTATFSFARQKFTSAYASNVATGMIFGAGSTAAIGGNTQVALSNPLYNALGATLIQPPQNGMFVSSPTGTQVVNWQLGGRGVGLDPEGTQNGTDVDNFGNFDYSFGTAVYTTVEPLKDSNAAGRYYYGDLVIKFSRVVKDPVIHLGGLGGSYEYVRLADNVTVKAYFSTELELGNPGVTSTFMAGNEYFNVVSATNKILNAAPFPNGGSYSVGAGTNYGAATGSVRLNGTFDSLVYKVYVRGSVNSQFNFSARMAQIAGATRDPFNGDLFYVAVSMNKPTQQISGSVYNDRDIADNNIYQSLGLPNGRTNIGGALYAFLLNGATVVASVPIDANGNYLFDNVPIGTYTVELRNGAAATGPGLPVGWSNTGEKIDLGAGTDGSANGISASFGLIAGQIKEQVNFGIRVPPCPTGLNRLFLDQVTKINYFGGFESGAHNFDSSVTIDAGGPLFMPFKMVAKTKLSPANYNIVYSPDLFAGSGFSSFTPLSGMNQMVVKTTSASDTAWYLQDSVGFTTTAPIKQGYFVKNSSGNFSGWFSKVNAGADPVIKIVVFDANTPSKVYGTTTQTITGPAGTWRSINVNWQFSDSLCKKLKIAIISTVNNSSFAMDNLCANALLAAGPVPIILSEFNAIKNNCTANLSWKTSTESNSDRFEVEISTGNNPTYASVGTVAAAGNSSTTKSYQFSYPMQQGVVYYFRLKMIDKDGSFKYSEIRSLSCTKGKNGIAIAPNPVKTRFTITGMENGKNSILVYAANGQLVKAQVIAQNQGDVNVSYLAPGLYTVKVTSETGNTVVNKLIKY